MTVAQLKASRRAYERKIRSLGAIAEQHLLKVNKMLGTTDVHLDIDVDVALTLKEGTAQIRVASQSLSLQVAVDRNDKTEFFSSIAPTSRRNACATWSMTVCH